MAISIERIVSGKLRQNGYVVYGESGDAIFVDPGGNADEFAAVVEKRGLRPQAIINTHAHFDHIGAVKPLMDRYGIPFYLDGGDSRILRSANIYKFQFESKESVEIPSITHDLAHLVHPIAFGEVTVATIPTPGHTPGGRSLLIDGQLFTGDTLFRTNVGRTDLYGGDAEALGDSVRRLMTLPPATVFHPGHGQPTTLGEARRHNVFAQRLIGHQSIARRAASHRPRP